MKISKINGRHVFVSDSSDRPTDAASDMSVPRRTDIPSGAYSPVYVQAGDADTSKPSIFGDILNWKNLLAVGVGYAIYKRIAPHSRNVPDGDKIHNRVLDSVLEDVSKTQRDVASALKQNDGDIKLTFVSMKYDGVDKSVLDRLQQIERQAQSLTTQSDQLLASIMTTVFIYQAIAFSICGKRAVDERIRTLIDKQYERYLNWVKEQTVAFQSAIISLYKNDSSVVQQCVDGVFIPKIGNTTTTTDKRTTTGSNTDIVFGIIGSRESSTTDHITSVTTRLEKTLVFQCTRTHIDLSFEALKDSRKSQQYIRLLHVFMSLISKVPDPRKMLEAYLS